jgi:branched-chain amino acid transport system substrate-binding protein
LGQSAADPSGTTVSFKIIARDAESDVTLTAPVLRELVANEQVKSILGPLLSEPAEAARQAAQSVNVPLFTLTKRDNFMLGQGIYRLGLTISSQVAALLENTSKYMGLKRYALIYPNDALGQEYADQFKQALTARGLFLVYENQYAKDDSAGMIAIAQELETQKIDAVFLADSITAASRFFGNLSARFREQVRMLGPATWDNALELKRSEAVLDGAIFVSPFFKASTRSVVRQFIESYTARYSEDPDFLAAQGFDLATIVLSALKRAVLEQINFDQALMGIDNYEGITGTMHIDGSGEILRDLAVVEWRGGKFREVVEPPVPSFKLVGDSIGVNGPETQGAGR